MNNHVAQAQADKGAILFYVPKEQLSWPTLAVLLIAFVDAAIAFSIVAQPANAFLSFQAALLPIPLWTFGLLFFIFAHVQILAWLKWRNALAVGAASWPLYLLAMGLLWQVINSPTAPLVHVAIYMAWIFGKLGIIFLTERYYNIYALYVGLLQQNGTGSK